MYLIIVSYWMSFVSSILATGLAIAGQYTAAFLMAMAAIVFNYAPNLSPGEFISTLMKYEKLPEAGLFYSVLMIIPAGFGLLKFPDLFTFGLAFHILVTLPITIIFQKENAWLKVVLIAVFYGMAIQFSFVRVVLAYIFLGFGIIVLLGAIGSKFK